jgi:hypothetical protein
MKEMFNFPQKKGKNYISTSNEKIVVQLNEIKIKNFNNLNNNNDYYIECIIPINNNNDNINIIKDIDNNAKTTLINNYNEWFDSDNEDNIEEIINNIYINSYNIDDNNITLLLTNKIGTDIIINDEEKEHYELIEYINNNKKNKNNIINIEIIFLGIYINKSNIINKWAIKYINIDNLEENNYIDWNKKEIEEEWHYDIINYEEEINRKINNLSNNLNNVKILYKEIINENNIKTWENKLNKLKTLILKK